MVNLDHLKTAVGQVQEWVQNTYALIDHVADALTRIGLLESGSRSLLTFYPADFLLDKSEAIRATPKVINGQPVQELSVDDVAHPGRGYLPLEAATQYDLKLIMQMAAADANDHIALVARVYDASDSLLRETSFNDIDAPSGTSEFEITLSGVMLNSTAGDPHHGRIEIERAASSTSSKTVGLQLKIVEVIRV